MIGESEEMGDETAGERTADLAAEVGLNANTLRHRWTYAGLEVGRFGPPARCGAAQAEILWARREQGERTDDLAAEAGIDPTLLRRLWQDAGHSAGLLYDLEQRVLTDRHARALWRRYLGGERSAVLAVEAGVCADHLCARWRDLGYGAAAVRRVQTDRRLGLPQWLAWRRSGLSYAEIAARAGGSASNVQRALRAYTARLEVPPP